ncbi:MAG: tetratricopeptide repeat protein [Chloroflexi bacterium]|nr:tetratricopeptide repeat protein [Chloroflexota bacterium]
MNRRYFLLPILAFSILLASCRDKPSAPPASTQAQPAATIAAHSPEPSETPRLAEEDGAAAKDTPAEAITALDRAIEIDPKNPAAYYGRGSVYVRQGNMDKAIADFDQAIKLNPDYIEAYISQGLAYTAKLDFKRAIADFDQVIQRDPKMAYAYYVRGLLYNSSGDKAEAVANLKKAISLGGDDQLVEQAKQLLPQIK